MRDLRIPAESSDTRASAGELSTHGEPITAADYHALQYKKMALFTENAIVVCYIQRRYFSLKTNHYLQ